MLKSEVLIVSVAVATSLILFFKLQSSGEAMAITNRRPETEPKEKKHDKKEAAADPCNDTPCVTFVGNIRVGDNFLLASPNTSLRNKDKRSFFQPLKPLLDSSTAVIGNLETPIVTNPPVKRADKLNIFWAEKKIVSALKDANITDVSLANKHIFDFGEEGLDATVAALKESEIRFVGLQSLKAEIEDAADTETQIEETVAAATADADDDTALSEQPEVPTEYRQTFTKDGASFEIALFNATNAPRSNPKDERWQILGFDVTELSKRLTDLKEKSPEVFAVAYLGNASVNGPATVKQQQDARALIDAGADLVVGYGSRFIQEIEKYNGKWIVYSLGEAASTADLTVPARNERWPFSGALRLILEKEGSKIVPSYRIYPIRNAAADTGFQPRLVGKKGLGDLFWYLLRKERIEYDPVRKKKMLTGMDTTGRFVSLTRGAQ